MERARHLALRHHQFYRQQSRRVLLRTAFFCGERHYRHSEFWRSSDGSFQHAQSFGSRTAGIRPCVWLVCLRLCPLPPPLPKETTSTNLRFVVWWVGLSGVWRCGQQKHPLITASQPGVLAGGACVPDKQETGGFGVCSGLCLLSSPHDAKETTPTTNLRFVVARRVRLSGIWHCGQQNAPHHSLSSGSFSRQCLRAGQASGQGIRGLWPAIYN